jgi:hypothetical protein
MAGDWIKFELATIDKPEVLQMADLMDMTSDEVVGKLLRVWGWFDQRSLNGDAGGVTGVTLMKFIDRHVGRQGFAACMKKVGWLGEDGLPNFDRHNGETAKNRALTKRRMKRLRNADVTQSVTQTPSPEKRREEVKEATSPPDGGPIWTEGLAILTDQGLSEKAARSYLGLLCRDYEEAEIVAAVKAAVGKADAKAYIGGVLKTRPKKGPGGLRVAV